MFYKFSSAVTEKLGFYVYRLIDPRDGQTFYVGKGQNNRVFEHIAEEKVVLNSISEKIQQIRAIKEIGLDVQHVIHRHGMTEEKALEVEAALIDAYTGLTNLQNGYANNDRGCMHASEIIQKYEADPIDLKHKGMAISINRSFKDYENSIYDCVRFAWKVNVDRANKIDIVLAVKNGLIREVFVDVKWKRATRENFPDLPFWQTLDGTLGEIDKYGFTAVKAPDEIRKLYIHRRLPEGKNIPQLGFTYLN